MNFARNQTELAEELSRQSGVSVTRRSIQRWRQDPRYKAFFPKPRADGRHKVSDYIAFMRRFGLKRADEMVEKLFSDRTPAFRQDLEKCCAQVFIEVGRECFKELQIDLPTENETA